jgi:hypothetical protein
VVAILIVRVGDLVSPAPGHHNMYEYAEDGALVDRVAPFLAEGLAAHEAVVVVVDPRKRALLGEALGALAGQVDYVDRDTYYTRPEDALAGYDAHRSAGTCAVGRSGSGSSASCPSVAPRSRAIRGSATRRY